ncbi:unnamed protein product [Meloidogyne enterolobii]|uniref:Uncharacterized protein n=1 Tax=Meloidogyne enterolobii TaxID=390850 RepID=A0ACB0XM57_MELEN
MYLWQTCWLSELSTIVLSFILPLYLPLISSFLFSYLYFFFLKIFFCFSCLLPGLHSKYII